MITQIFYYEYKTESVFIDDSFMERTDFYKKHSNTPIYGIYPEKYQN